MEDDSSIDEESSPYHAEVAPAIALSWEKQPGVPKNIIEGCRDDGGFARKIQARLKSPPCKSKSQRESIARKIIEKMRKQDDPFAMAIAKCTADDSGPSDDLGDDLVRSRPSSDDLGDALGRSCRLGRKVWLRSSSSEVLSYMGDELGSEVDDDDFSSHYWQTRKLFMM